MNIATGNAKWPKTLVEAYNIASKVKTIQKSFSKSSTEKSHEIESVYYNKKKGEHDGKSKDGKPKSTDTNNSSDDKKSKRHGNCRLCDSKDHWQSDCPYLSQCKSFIKEDQSSKTSKVDANVTLSKSNSVKFQFVSIIVSEEILAAASSGVLADTDVLFDTCASGSLFQNSALLNNIRESNITVEFNGVGGSLTTNLVGDLDNFGTVPYSPDAPANIICFSDAEDKYKVHYQQSKYFKVIVPDGNSNNKIYHFYRKNKLYVGDYAEVDKWE